MMLDALMNPRPPATSVMLEALPNFVVAGVPRCGTSALFAYLAAHPQVAASRVKETQYFVDAGSALLHRNSNYLQHGISGYTPYFAPSADETPHAPILFEATPSYIYQRTALAAMPTLPSRPKFLFQLRRPSEQIYSSYLYSLHRAGNLPRDVSLREFAFGSERMAASKNEFHRCALAFTDYESFLSQWRSACGDARIRVTCFETLRDDPHTYMRSLASWLGIEPDFYDEFDFTVVNRNVAIRSRAAQNVVHRLSPLLVGPARNLGRGVYHRMNTMTLSQPSADDRAVIAEIDERMWDANERLRERFDVDVRLWGAA